MDSVDKDIMIELFRNCRVSYEDLGQKIGLTSSSVWRRVSLLLESGIIERFVTHLSADIVKSDPVLIFVSTNGEENEEELVEAIVNHPMVVSVSPVINRLCLVVSEIVMERDVSNTDQYGRLLLYVYVGNLFVNGEMVRLGWANAKAYPPDTKNQKHLEGLEAVAREAKRGMWAK